MLFISYDLAWQVVKRGKVRNLFGVRILHKSGAQCNEGAEGEGVSLFGKKFESDEGRHTTYASTTPGRGSIQWRNSSTVNTGCKSNLGSGGQGLHVAAPATRYPASIRGGLGSRETKLSIRVRHAQ